MAASEPSEDTPSWVNIIDSDEPKVAGVSSVSILNSTIQSRRKETGSTLDSSPDEREDGDKSSSSVSPVLDARNSVKPHYVIGSMPSPIQKPGHSKTTSATSPLLTLTPESSVDGISDWNAHGGGSQARDTLGPTPSVPFLADNTASFRDDNDGLLGLTALRERTHSAPMFGGHFPGQHSFQPEFSARKPPLSSNPGYEVSSHGGDRSVGDRSTGSGYHSIGSRDASNLSYESSEMRRLGAIGRGGGTELRRGATEFEPDRRLSADQDSYIAAQQHVIGMEQLTHKFGSLPTLSMHVQQQRMPQSRDLNFEVAKSGHVRSVSQPYLQDYGEGNLSSSFDPRFYQSSSLHGGQSYGPAVLSRASSSGFNGISKSYDDHSSMARRFGQQGFGGYSGLQRRDALDFNPNNISPGQSPLTMQYPSHVRSQSGNGSFLGASPQSLGSAGMQRSSSSLPVGAGPDLGHPLMGEHIEVCGEQYDPMTGLVRDGSTPRLLRSSSTGHSVAMTNNTAAMSVPQLVYSVKFKRTQRNFVIGPRINRDLKIGTYVKVEADRGEDLGIVVGKVTADKYQYAGRSSFTAGMGPPPGSSLADLKRIIRLATHDEVNLLSVKRDEEEELLKICREKVRQRALPMHVVDAEYQFDRHKLTFFFEAEGRVDFRELVRDLFSMYKTRIWMQQLDKSTSHTAQAMLAPQTISAHMDYGTPIIAPVSEFADSIVLNGMSGS